MKLADSIIGRDVHEITISDREVTLLFLGSSGFSKVILTPIASFANCRFESVENFNVLDGNKILSVTQRDIYKGYVCKDNENMEHVTRYSIDIETEKGICSLICIAYSNEETLDHTVVEIQD